MFENVEFGMELAMPSAIKIQITSIKQPGIKLSNLAEKLLPHDCICKTIDEIIYIKGYTIKELF